MINVMMMSFREKFCFHYIFKSKAVNSLADVGYQKDSLMLGSGCTNQGTPHEYLGAATGA